MTNSHAALADLIPLAQRAADAAATITLAAFRQPLGVHDKSTGAASAFDPVTDADRDAERAIREVLRAGAPGIGFVGEESFGGLAEAPGALDPAWIVDPIDGTRAFIAGVPVWGTLIALRLGGRPVFGLLDQPVLNERYLGHDGNAVRVANDQSFPLSTRRGVALSAAVLCCTTPDMFDTPALREAFGQLSSRVPIVRYGTDCHGYAMLASGHVDLVVEADLAPWDVQALIPIVEGAGGVISDWRGADPSGGGTVLAAGGRTLHAEALHALALPN